MARAVNPVESEGVVERAELNMFTNTYFTDLYITPDIKYI